MISVIQSLLQGEDKFALYFKKADEFWGDFFAGKDDWAVDQLKEALSRAQSSFEYTVFDMNRADAKETMAVTCIGYLYDETEGFGDKHDLAVRVGKAFLASMCSIEVKSYAEDAIVLYSLDDDDEGLRRAVRK